MNHEGTPASSEQAAFDHLTQDLEEERKPTDGYDPVPRPNPFEGLTGEEQREDGRNPIPPGHIALQGDFDQDTPDSDSH